MGLHLDVNPDDFLSSPYEGVPAFFVRRLHQEPGPDPAQLEELRKAFGLDFIVESGPLPTDLTIYGASIQSPYPEDWRVEKEAYERSRVFYAACYSVACPGGELGTVPLDAVEEITQKEFWSAYERGWSPT